MLGIVGTIQTIKATFLFVYMIFWFINYSNKLKKYDEPNFEI